ncbi:MAG: penicillin acylase family protein [Balneola sp.]
MNTFVKLLIFFLILFLGFTGLAFYWTFYKPLPNYEATIQFNGLNNEVDVHWDEFGVPHIYSNDEQDLYRAMGYVHAQDRLWQMTLSQIAAEGRFAEFFGEDLLELDKYQRTLGLWKTAVEIEKNELGEKERTILQAYADGVNEYIDNNRNKLPVEFALTGIQPIKWSPTRSIAITRLMAWELNMSWWTEVMYGYLQANLPADQFEQLQLRYPNNAPTTLNDAESTKLTVSLMPMLQQEIEKRELLQMQGTHVGSNAWVVDGSKTNTGYPLLAGDPHLGLDMPGKWYEVHLNLNGRNVSGATLAGVPGVVIGQNDEMAWSFTNIMADDTDFFIELVDPNDRGRYVADSLNDSTATYLPFNKVREVIKVKDSDDVILETRYTKHGPIISDIYPGSGLVDGQLISMQWTGHKLSNEFKSLYQINWAQNFQNFKDALPYFGVPGQNFMYADKVGNIAMFSTAHLPIRTGDKVALRRGWNPEEDWLGYIPHEEMPSIINPEKGWIANANNKITTNGYDHYLATFWEPPSRMERIVEVLESNDKLTPQTFSNLQNDVYSKHAEALTPIILDIIKNQNVYNFDNAVSYLENWDFRYTTNATAASIFDVFFLNFTKNTLLDNFGEEVYTNFIHHENVPIRTMGALMLQTPATVDTNAFSFFDNVNTSEIETKTDMVLQSMQDAIFFLSDSLGSQSEDWRWEQLHKLTLRPPLFAQAAAEPDAPSSLKLIVNNLLSKGPYEMDGHGMSVDNAQYDWLNPFEMVLGPSIRRIVDLSNLSAVQSITPTGQSGSPFSEHFGDQTEMWLNGQYRIFYQDSTLFEQSDLSTMKLVPKKN